MEEIAIGASGLSTSRIGLGTWAIGGWMWGGSDEARSIATIRAAVERGITLIDTAPVYGFGRSEEIVGKALDLGCDVLDDPLRILEVAAGCREERRREPAHLVADIEDLVLLGFCHGCPFPETMRNPYSPLRARRRRALLLPPVSGMRRRMATAPRPGGTSATPRQGGP